MPHHRVSNYNLTSFTRWRGSRKKVTESDSCGVNMSLKTSLWNNSCKYNAISSVNLAITSSKVNFIYYFVIPTRERWLIKRKKYKDQHISQSIGIGFPLHIHHKFRQQPISSLRTAPQWHQPRFGYLVMATIECGRLLIISISTTWRRQTRMSQIKWVGMMSAWLIIKNELRRSYKLVGTLPLSLWSLSLETFKTNRQHYDDHWMSRS